MNKKKLVQLIILLVIFLSMLAIIFVSRSFFLTNNQTYQPSDQQIKIKASQKTYSRLIALNRTPSVENELSPSPILEENSSSPTSLISPTLIPTFITESPTPTEIILAKAISPTVDLSITIGPTSELISNNKEYQELPASGFYQNLQWLFVISTLIILFSFVL